MLAKFFRYTVSQDGGVYGIYTLRVDGTEAV